MTGIPNASLSVLGIARSVPVPNVDKIIPLVERALTSRLSENQKASLPLLATANDLRELIRYLKKHHEGVTLVEALGEVKKRILDPRKISAYETWGVVTRHGDWLKLSDLGWEFSRRLAGEAALFRSILDQVEPYRTVLELTQSQQLKLITHEDIARFWRAKYADLYDLHQPKTVEAYVVCFLHLCQAAELGSLTVGKRGQPARLRIDPDELEAFINSRWGNWLSEAGNRSELRSFRPSMPNILAWAGGRFRICLSFGSGQNNLDHLQSMLELVGIESELLERRTDSSLSLSENAFETMRSCDAALFSVTTGDCIPDESLGWKLKPELQAEISAAYLFYSRRIFLLWDEQIPMAHDWQQLPHLKTCQSQLNWDVGIELTRALAGFRQ